MNDDFKDKTNIFVDLSEKVVSNAKEDLGNNLNKIGGEIENYFNGVLNVITNLNVSQIGLPQLEKNKTSFINDVREARENVQNFFDIVKNLFKPKNEKDKNLV